MKTAKGKSNFENWQGKRKAWNGYRADIWNGHDFNMDRILQVETWYKSIAEGKLQLAQMDDLLAVQIGNLTGIASIN